MTTNSIAPGFKNQFDLVKGGDKNDNFSKNKYNYLNAPTTYIEPVNINNMVPNNYLDLMTKTENIQRVSGRRDNTLIIKDYHSNEVGQYATPKKEINYLFEPIVNQNALAGDTKIVDKIGLARYNDTLKYKTNDFPENTNIRPEWIDGVPMNENLRPREKSLEERRGLGVNSQRLDPNARNNQTGQYGEGVSTNPKDINITKFKMKSYRNQDSVDDLLRTTGVITRPEWRSLVKESNSERSYMKTIDGPAMATVMRTEYHNEQAARPTIKEETIVNNYLSNAFSNVARETYRNEQSAKPTNRMDYEDNTQILNTKALVERNTYHNEQSANPTIRMDYENQMHMLNTKALVDRNTYHNEQSANPTIRMDYENQMHMLNTKSLVDRNTYRNEQSALPTLREDANNYAGHGNNYISGYVYENAQSANPTLREDANEYAGHGNNSMTGYVYENHQAANPTFRMLSEENNFTGVGFNQTNSSYKKFVDITRSGVVEDVLARDYNGPEMAFVPKDESRLQFKNMVINESIESTMDLTKRDLMGGGVDRIPQGRDNIGKYNDWNRREKNPPISNRVRNVGINYVDEIPDTRGYNLLQERSPINQYVSQTLNNNPFVNNVDYKGTYQRDLIRENTILSDREIGRTEMDNKQTSAPIYDYKEIIKSVLN
jgi:hypothetical protein